MMDDDTHPDEHQVPGCLGARPGAVWLNLVPGTATTGLWCAACLLPSRYQVPIYFLGDEGLSQIGLVDRCDRCSE